ncbi:hypothetical protein NECAME_06670 [Necator americanus]|uniref:Uncharacterized protein n=1 Tax=Necator americanus TaxID=51031 RepID=W2TUP7_NECAM|nr:hypothetical protein NECAME_06670 [Necator americanus]ETN84786.1 hypothetical protein NECAME_06670 [Necator americanus]
MLVCGVLSAKQMEEEVNVNQTGSARFGLSLSALIVFSRIEELDALPSIIGSVSVFLYKFIYCLEEVPRTLCLRMILCLLSFRPKQLGYKKASTYVVVDSAAAIKRDINRKFGRHEKHFVLVPYHEELTCELDARFDHIKHGLITAVLVNEQRPGLRNFVFALKTFLSIYGFRFSKEEHVQLIQLFYLILVRKDQWPDIVNYAAKTLEDLVNRSYFNYDDITLDWEPLYNLYYDANYGKLEEIDGKNLRNAVFRLKRFYRPSETPKIWDKVGTAVNKTSCGVALACLRAAGLRLQTE